DGSMQCVGSDQEGELGDGSTNPMRSSPVRVCGLASRATAIAAGPSKTCALLDTGSIQCWGTNHDQRPIGAGPPFDAAPQSIPGITSAMQISAGAAACIVTSTGAAQCSQDGTLTTIALAGPAIAIAQTNDPHDCAVLA